MLEKVRKALRITTDLLDDEIKDLIDAGLIDLGISGVKKREEIDPLIQRAIILYTKANFGLENTESEKYQKGYESLRIHLALCGDYNGNV